MIWYYYGIQKYWKAGIFKNFYSKSQPQYTYFAVLDAKGLLLLPSAKLVILSENILAYFLCTCHISQSIVFSFFPSLLILSLLSLSLIPLFIFALSPTQLFTATWARMASTTRCAQKTWHHNWRKRRSPWTLELCCWTTTARATRTSALPCTSAVHRHTDLSLNLSWVG